GGHGLAKNSAGRRHRDGAMIRQAEFEAWLAQRAPREQWSALNLKDLALTWLALEGDAEARAEVHRRLGRVAKTAVGRRADAFLADVLQTALQRLLVGPKPRLAAYLGKGSLTQYLKAVVVTVAANASRGARHVHEHEDDRALADAVASDEAPDAAFARRTQRA